MGRIQINKECIRNIFEIFKKIFTKIFIREEDHCNFLGYFIDIIP